MKIIKEHAVQEGTLLLAVCAWLMYYALDGYNKAFNKDWTQSPYLFPIVLAVLFGILGLILIGQGVKKAHDAANKEKAEAAKKDRGAIVRVTVVFAMTLAYYFALSYISLPYMACTVGSVTLRLSTFEIATLVLLLAMMIYMGVRKKTVLILVPLCATVFLSVMFRSMLHVILP